MNNQTSKLTDNELDQVVGGGISLNSSPLTAGALIAPARPKPGIAYGGITTNPTYRYF